MTSYLAEGNAPGAWGLPEAAPSFPYVMTMLLIIGGVTVLLRWLPFAFADRMRGSEFIRMLGRTMPVGVMVALVVYTMVSRIDESVENAGVWWPAPVALLFTVGLHLWRRSPALSVLAGTAFYMVLINVVV